MDCLNDLTAGGGFGLCCSSAGRSDDIIKHGDLRREDTADFRCVRREDGPDRTVRAAILVSTDRGIRGEMARDGCRAPDRRQTASASGRHLRSTASGFSLGGSDRLTSHSSNSKMRILRSLALLAGIAATATDAVSVGDAIPSNIDLHFGFPPEMINVGERVAKKKVIIVGLPGAFTPT